MLGHGGQCRFLTGFRHLNLDLGMIHDLCYNHDPNYCSLFWFWRCKEHPSPLSPHWGLWRMLEVPYWGLASWYLFRYGHWSLIHQWSKLWPSILLLKVQRTSICRFLTGVWHLDLDLNMFTSLWYPYITNSGSLSWFWRCKEHPCPLSPHLGLWRTLEVPDWGLAFWSWLG